VRPDALTPTLSHRERERNETPLYHLPLLLGERVGVRGNMRPDSATRALSLKNKSKN